MRNILPANVATELDLNSGDSEVLLVGYRSLLYCIRIPRLIE